MQNSPSSLAPLGRRAYILAKPVLHKLGLLQLITSRRLTLPLPYAMLLFLTVDDLLDSAGSGCCWDREDRDEPLCGGARSMMDGWILYIP